MSAAAGSSKPSTATGAKRVIRSTRLGGPCTGVDLLTDKQRARIEALFAGDDHVEVEATWGIYQRMIAAYRDPDRARGRELMSSLIESVSQGVPTALTEVTTLGRTLTKRAADVLSYFDRPGTSNGPTEAINGRLEHLRGSARVPQPHQLHRQITTGDGRIPTPTTPSIVKSRFKRRALCADRRMAGLVEQDRPGRPSRLDQSKIVTAPR